VHAVTFSRRIVNAVFILQEGKTYGDEYLAELDYIEVIESTKEGYESDVPEDLEEDADEGKSRR
jgi:histone-lysine N-methyltransferase SETDB1